MLEKIMDAINEMEEEALDRLVIAAVQRRNSLHPDNEYMVLSVPRNDPEEKKRLLTLAIETVDREVKLSDKNVQRNN